MPAIIIFLLKYIKFLYLLYNTAVCLGRMSAHLHTSIPRSRIWLIYTYSRFLAILHLKQHVDHIIFFTFKDTHYRNTFWLRWCGHICQICHLSFIVLAFFWIQKSKYEVSQYKYCASEILLCISILGRIFAHNTKSNTAMINYILLSY